MLMTAAEDTVGKRICAGIFAHVDAGKTTLLEAMLYEAGELKSRGRVDHRDSHLDTDDFERARGITAFSKPAVFRFGETEFNILDTPGHSDLFSETLRGLPVLDLAILVISGSEGVQADTGTLWETIRKRSVPVWIFVSKMDLGNSSRQTILEELKKRLSPTIVDFQQSESLLMEELASLEENCLEEYLSAGSISQNCIIKAAADGAVTPCFFGSGMKLDGVREFLEQLDALSPEPKYTDCFSALCYKISRDAGGRRMTQVKITGGRLSVRDNLSYRTGKGKVLEEKVTGIRVYSGARYENVQQVCAGQLCSLLGPSETAAGMRFGEQQGPTVETEEAPRRYTLCPDDDRVDGNRLLFQLRELEEEFPELTPRSGREGISVCITGQMQADLLLTLLQERFDLHCRLENGRILYKESIRGRVEGIGHFEPLRHYAEVHLILEPLPIGSGLRIESCCPEDILDRNWQNLILNSLRETTLPGVLTGAELTDLRISLASGRAHPKHTEGGDFREAARRALRQGLMQAESYLLEPVYAFHMELPSEQLGRAINDLRGMEAVFELSEGKTGFSSLNGVVPVSELGDYRETLLSYSRGLGKLSLRPDGDRPCHDEERILEASDYDPERDTDWPAASLFCSHGAGRQVSWREVRDYMHLPSVLKEQREEELPVHHLQRIDDRELEEIMLREFGPIKRRSVTAPAQRATTESGQSMTPTKKTLLIDGYNFIFFDPELKEIAGESLDAARSALINRLANYSGFSGREIVLVFDGYRSAGNPGTRDNLPNIRLVFTQEGESADAYIERIAAEIGRNEQVSVVTADNLIRISAMRSGILRISPQEFSAELEESERSLRRLLEKSNFLPHLSTLKESRKD
ncbi:MAG: NYN domain-containing protein [Oscillospiraceae bacterium]|nr:NYN domain-containing protein [Oscillospiraceae bacterium]